MSATIIVAAILTVMLAFSAEAVSALASINLVGVLAAAFAAVVGFAWFIKKH
jgi:hypothetical protein